MSIVTTYPAELRERPQWLFTDPSCGDNKRPHTLGSRFRQIRGDDYSVPAHIDKPREWLTFGEAIDAASYFRGHIGFVLTADDPYTCIDFDVKPDTTMEWMEWAWNIAQQFDSYTEISAGGKGLHLWVRANIGAGRRKGSVEVYSQERFIICTGKPVITSPIRDRQEWVEELVARLTSTSTRGAPVPDEPERRTDDEILDRIARSAQWHKFYSLMCDGDWRGRYPSNSEADEALLAILFCYTRNGDQLKRLFRRSALAALRTHQPEKVWKNDRYLDRTIQSIRASRAIDPDLVSVVIAAADKVIQERLQDIERERAAREAIDRTVNTLRGL